MKELITTKSKYSYDDYYNEITEIMDKYNIAYKRDLRNKDKRDHEFWRVYIYDPEWYMDKGLEYFDELFQKVVKKDFIYLPLRVPGITIGHIALNKDFIIDHVRLYEDCCFGETGADRRFTSGLKEILFEEFKGRKIVLKKWQ